MIRWTSALEVTSAWRWLLLLALLVSPHTGCKRSQLNSSGTDVAVLSYEPSGCEKLGQVVGHGGGVGGGYVGKSALIDAATDRARNQAAEMGATHLVVGEPEIVHGKGTAHEHDMQPALGHGDGSSANASVTAVAYKCPPGAAPREAEATLPAVDNPPAEISLAPLGTLERVHVYQKTSATPSTPAAEVEVNTIDDPAQVQEVAASLTELALDPIKYIPTHRIEFVGELGTQSLLYGFGYLQYAGKTYRLTTATFEETLGLVTAPESSDRPSQPGSEEPAGSAASSGSADAPSDEP